MCNNPADVECRSVSQQIDFADFSFNPDISYAYCNTDQGFTCRNNDAISGTECDDFEIRFYCCGMCVAICFLIMFWLN